MVTIQVNRSSNMAKPSDRATIVGIFSARTASGFTLNFGATGLDVIDVRDA